jgi:hypothetical protein
MAASIGRKRVEEPVTVRAPGGSTTTPADELQTIGLCSFALHRLKGFPASLSGIGARCCITGSWRCRLAAPEFRLADRVTPKVG